MSNQLTHDQIIAKLQHFADGLRLHKLEKESLSMSLDRSEQKTQIHNQILIYDEIIEEYHNEFQNIICR